MCPRANEPGQQRIVGLVDAGERLVEGRMLRMSPWVVRCSCIAQETRRECGCDASAVTSRHSERPIGDAARDRWLTSGEPRRQHQRQWRRQQRAHQRCIRKRRTSTQARGIAVRHVRAPLQRKQ
jgi:hypothetical protein